MPSPRCSTRAQRRASAVRGVRASIRCGPPCAGAGSHVPRLVHAGLAEELRLPELRWLKQDNDTVALDLLISAQLLGFGVLGDLKGAEERWVAVHPDLSSAP